MTVKQLRSLLRQRELPVPGRKSVLVGRLKNNEGQNIDTADYKSLNVKQLQSLLRQRGLPLSGRKRELVERLQHGGRGRSTKTGPKPKAWQHREAKKDLKRSLLNPSSPIHNMTLEDMKLWWTVWSISQLRKILRWLEEASRGGEEAGSSRRHSSGEVHEKQPEIFFEPKRIPALEHACSKGITGSGRCK